MNLLIKLGLVSLLLLSQACDSTKSTAQEESKKSEKSQNMAQDLIAQGYSKGTLTAQRNSACAFVIVDEKSGAKFDPINLNEEKFTSFANADNEVVYYKFSPLRMQNRCPEAQPISIVDIKKGEG